MDGYSHPIISQKTKEAFDRLTQASVHIPVEKFFEQPVDKWSIAENIRHLVVSTNASTLAFRLPTIMLKFIAAKANRPSRSYDELVAKYKKKLSEGGKASGKFIPAKFSSMSEEEKNKLLKKWRVATGKYLSSFDRNPIGEILDRYAIPHPLLGKITLRELAYFTIYHTQHHLNIIQSRL